MIEMTEKPPIRVVLHGGLGNQLFQYFVGRLEAERQPLHRLHLLTDLLEKYETARGLELGRLLTAEGLDSVSVQGADPLALARVPKLIWRVTKREFVLKLPFYGTLIDGYYQWPRAYLDHDDTAISHVIASWRTALLRDGALQIADRPTITHLRLGDFFRSQGGARAFAQSKLESLTEATDLITDQEELVLKVLLSLSSAPAIKVIPTRDLDAWQLFKLLGRYRHISTNGSSLAFWVATLGGVTLTTTNSDHMAIWRRFTKPIAKHYAD